MTRSVGSSGIGCSPFAIECFLQGAGENVLPCPKVPQGGIGFHGECSIGAQINAQSGDVLVGRGMECQAVGRELNRISVPRQSGLEVGHHRLPSQMPCAVKEPVIAIRFNRMFNVRP